MSGEPITVALVGVGRIGQMHARNLVERIPEARLKAIVDPSLSPSWGADLGIPVRCSELQQVLDDEEIRALVVAAPSRCHVQTVLAGAAAGKHIFCEKPIAFDTEGIDRAAAATKRAGVLLQPGLNRRFDRSFRAARDQACNGAVGRIDTIRIVNRDPLRPRPGFLQDSGGLFMDFTIHDFDMVRFLTRSEIVEIFVAGAVLIDPSIAEAGDLDTAVITMRLSCGALATIDNSRETGYGYDQRAEIFGSEGSIAVSNPQTASTVRAGKGAILSAPLHSSFVERYADAYVEELRSFLRVVRDGGDLEVTALDLRAAVEAASAAHVSWREKRRVELPPKRLEGVHA